MVEYNLTGQLANFEEAFSLCISSLREECNCGKVYYDTYNDYDWGEGEYENLENNPNSVPVCHSIGTIQFDSKRYVNVCDCWHEQAQKYLNWLGCFSKEVANFLSMEKKRLSIEAANIPLVDDGWCHMDSAPKDGRNIYVKLEDGQELIAHWAQDLSGECQPSFQGWFTKEGKTGYGQIKPKQWKLNQNI